MQTRPLSTIRQILTIGLFFVVGTANAQYNDGGPFPLRVGVPAEANINDDNPGDIYEFEVPAGADITVTMENTSGDLDPFLTIIGPAGVAQQNDDRAQGDRDAEITLEDAPAGLYTVDATRFNSVDGPTSGTYRLTLRVTGVDAGSPTLDPLTAPPPYSVPFTRLAYQTFGAGELDEDNPEQYFAVGGDQGDLMRAILTVTGESDLTADVRILTPNLAVISDVQGPRPGEVLAYATLPARDWYLVQVTRLDGAGTFSLFVDGIAGQVVDFASDDLLTGTFTPTTPGTSYLVNGRLGDSLFITASVTDGAATPQIRLLDIQQRQLEVADGTGIALLQTALPRSGPYIVQVNNTTPGSSGGYSVRFVAVETDTEKLVTVPAEYNTAYKGEITMDNARDLYAFDGTAGELITLNMRAASGDLDPFIALMDGNLRELVSNDNTRGGRDARINQFALPADGTYYVLAGRSDLSFGTSTGGYDLALSAGAIALESGAMTVTLGWAGDDDLNLFIREPSGRIISWSNPDPAESATLQVDSNTNCETVSAQPVEHIFWPDEVFPSNGDYEVWVWYQAACGAAPAVTFDLSLSQTVNGLTETVTSRTGTLNAGERFELGVRVSQPEVFILGNGRVSQPTPQQRVSEGGDLPLLYGQTVTGSINDEVYARFYQFDGNAGDVVEIELTTVTGTLDPLLILRDDNERDVARADDISEENRNALMQVTLPSDSRYVIAVTRFGVRNGLTTGDYSLTLRRMGGA